MTQTMQPCSWAVLNKTGKNLNTNKPEKEDNMSLLLPVFDSLNALCEKLNRLNYLIERKKLEQLINSQSGCKGLPGDCEHQPDRRP